jgi:hypothetical protein
MIRLILLIVPSASKGINLLKKPDFVDNRASDWYPLGKARIAASTKPYNDSHNGATSYGLMPEMGSNFRSYTDLYIMAEQRLSTNSMVMSSYCSPDIYLDENTGVNQCNFSVFSFDQLNHNNPEDSDCTTKR